MDLLSKIFLYFREKEAMRMGEELYKAEQAKKEILVVREQTEILLKDETREETIKKLEDGKF